MLAAVLGAVHVHACRRAPQMLGCTAQFWTSASILAPQPSMLDQLLDYAHEQCKAQATEQALDVLKSGLNFPQLAPQDTARLHLARAAIEANRSNWGQVLSSSSAAGALVTSQHPNELLSALTLVVKASLVQGADSEALAAARKAHTLLGTMSTVAPAATGLRLLTEVVTLPLSSSASSSSSSSPLSSSSSSSSPQSSSPSTASASSQTNNNGSGEDTERARVVSELAATAAIAFDAATAAAAAASTSGHASGAVAAAGRVGGDEGSGGAAAAAAAAPAGLGYALALWRLRGGDVEGAKAALEGAAKLAGRSREALAQAVQAGSGSGGSGSGGGGSDGVTGSQAAALRLDHTLLCEVEADAHLALAQLLAASRKWEAAEDALSAALKAAEAVGDERNPRITPVLLALGYVYSRSGRITFAEGLYREAAKLLKLDPSRHTSGATVPSVSAVHPTLAAALAWRFHQLLSALPNRGSEAAHWHEFALSFWSSATAGSGAGTQAGSGAAPSLESVFGGKELLRGLSATGDGSGALLSVQLRRALLLPLPAAAAASTPGKAN